MGLSITTCGDVIVVGICSQIGDVGTLDHAFPFSATPARAYPVCEHDKLDRVMVDLKMCSSCE